jgi:hypothetical protein
VIVKSQKIYLTRTFQGENSFHVLIFIYLLHVVSPHHTAIRVFSKYCVFHGQFEPSA